MVVGWIRWVFVMRFWYRDDQPMLEEPGNELHYQIKKSSEMVDQGGALVA